MTQEELKQLLYYDHETGVFTWLVDIANHVKKGMVAGSKAKNGYFRTAIKGKHYYLHRLAWFYVHGVFPNELDHANGVKTDNRLCNLRKATRNQNMRNSFVRGDNKVGIKGVERQGDKFRARTRFNGKRIYLGTYDTKEQASRAFQKFAKQHYGEFHKEIL